MTRFNLSIVPIAFAFLILGQSSGNADDALSAGWTGLSLGITGGWAKTETQATGVVVNGTSVGSIPGAFTAVGASGGTITSLTTTSGNPNALESSGFIGGAVAGYDHQFGPAVVGIEADFSGLDADDTYSAALAGTLPGVGAFTGSGSVSSDIDWLATFRVRAGYLVTPRVLAYATGGLAVASMQTTLSATATVGAASATVSAGDSKTPVGYTVGAGVEANLHGNWFARGEYLYVDLGSNTFNYSLAGSTIGLSTDVDSHVVRFAFTYRFKHD